MRDVPTEMRPAPCGRVAERGVHVQGTCQRVCASARKVYLLLGIA